MGSELQSKSCDTSRRTAAKRKIRRTKITSCDRCGFQSKRAFNVIRHYERIHEPAKRPIKCCGTKYLTKGEFYQHCANSHPETRKSSIVSTSVYKIMRNAVKREQLPMRRRSLRHIKSEEKKYNEKPKKNQDFDIDEDTPLINYLKNSRKFIKKEKKSIKFEDFDRHELDVTCIKIFFKGDATSPFHAQIQREFLGNIDFENFKIA